jgi:bifunctional DNA-binding transcriptional regulator/antitoxin component of YhaV-PrlF toxin-antitoxin module
MTIPKKELKALGLEVGDEVEYTLKPVKDTKHAKLMSEYDSFVDQYGETLKNLADR